ncbi:uncharacterized protein LOC110896601 [Helianthus annuus]|uniref:uncharacterized protein LOC110896601 n=1 Tax=Helianthus annuus TaxID=4232 RepID=UPI000B8EFD55|nr:uncharacterized protein LOC110896601 [Helianthus annuus]
MGDKHVWSNDQLKCLLETCIEEVNKVGRKGLSLHKESWTRLGNVLKERFGIDLAQKQMKNAHDNLKAKYVGWCYLREKTGNIYNPQTNMFTLTNEEWEDFKKGHPKAGGLKTGPLPFPELCAQLFDGNTATGNSRWTPTQVTSGVGSNSNRGQSLMLMDSVFNEVEDDAGTSEGPTEPTAEPTPEPTHEPNPEGNPKKKDKNLQKNYQQ